MVAGDKTWTTERLAEVEAISQELAHALEVLNSSTADESAKEDGIVSLNEQDCPALQKVWVSGGVAGHLGLRNR